MKKINKESMQDFLLMHAEKLILGACIAATGFFVWTSMGGENEAKETPSDLLKIANSAQAYIDRPAWDGDDKLQSFRQGEKAAREKIEGAKRVDPTKYSLSMIGTPTAALAPRKDPEIFGPEQAIAKRFTVGVLLDLPDFRSPLADFFQAPTREGDGEGGFDGFDGGDFGPGGGDFGGGDVGRTGLPEDYPTLDRSGKFNEVNAFTYKGLRPQALGIAPDRITTSVLDVVCVTAVVDYQKQVAAYEKAFAESVAYNAKRDRPVYQFLQVQRREIADQETEWQDISEDVMYTYPQGCPNSLSKMPRQVYKSAPEVVAPINYDPILSGVIPAFVMLDYQQIATHPALKQKREFPAWSAPKKRGVLPGDDAPEIDMFNRSAGPDDDEYGGGGPGGADDINALRKGSETEPYKEALRNPGGQYRLVRFFDLEASKNKSFEYRTRIWIGDPNQLDPTDGFNKNRAKRLEVDKDGGVKFAAGLGADDGGIPDVDDDDGSDLDGKQQEVVQDVQRSMLTPPVRKRLASASSLDNMEEKLEEVAVSNEPMDPFYVSEYTEANKLEQIKLPPSPRKYAYIQYLRFARPSPWSEPVRVQAKRSTSDVYAGPARRPRTVSMAAGAGQAEFELGEPSIEVVVSSWVRYLGTKLPSKKRVYLGETLDFKSPAYVTHPISWQVLVAENPRVKSEDLEKFMLQFRTGETVVDAFFGQTMQFPIDKRQEVAMPTEVLTVDANGNLSVSNQFDSATDYRNEITEADSSRFYGRRRRQKPVEEDEYGDFGDDPR